jgi:hypothetical protein
LRVVAYRHESPLMRRALHIRLPSQDVDLEWFTLRKAVVTEHSKHKDDGKKAELLCEIYFGLHLIDDPLATFQAK